MSKILYIIGGRQNIGTASFELHRCNAGIVLQLDLDSGNVKRVLKYVTPLECKADKDASIVFKAGHVDKEKLYLCTTTEVLIYDINNLSLNN